jgi:hypothetical protein
MPGVTSPCSARLQIETVPPTLAGETPCPHCAAVNRQDGNAATGSTFTRTLTGVMNAADCKMELILLALRSCASTPIC